MILLNYTREVIRTCAVITLLILCQGTAIACGTDASCNADEIDRFFLPLIAASLMKDRVVGTDLLPLSALPAWPTSPVITHIQKPVVINAPSHPDPAPPVPTITLRQHLVPGDLAEGGTVELIIEQSLSSAGQPDIVDSAKRQGMDQILPNHQTVSPASIWRIHHMATLPAVPSWPIDGMTLPIDMRLTCGACGPGGSLHDFSGSAQLEMLFGDSVIGWINDIDLVAGDGMTATGFLTFADEQAGHQLIRDHHAEMFLRLGEDETNFRGDIYSWMTDKSRVNGAISMVPVDRRVGVGAIAGHFSGTP